MSSSVWIYSGLIPSGEHQTLLRSLQKEARLERWGHGAEIPLNEQGDEIFVLLSGSVVISTKAQELDRLVVGSAFGKAKARDAFDGTSKSRILSFEDTLLAALPMEAFQNLLGDRHLFRSVEAGRWRKKQTLEVPTFPFLGTLPTHRLSQLLLYLAETYGEHEANRARLSSPLRVKHLQKLSGLTDSQMGQAWDLFQRTGLVNSTSQGLVLPDLDRLRKLIK